MAISTENIKQLRDSTGVSIAQCKKALEDANGDMAKALEFLKAKSKDIAGKKADRAFGAGAIASYIHNTGRVGALVELVSETDFVSNNEGFKTLARDIAVHIVASDVGFVHTSDVPAGQEAAAEGRILLLQPYFKNPENTIQNLIDGAIQKFGEKIDVLRFAKFAVLQE